MEKVSIAKHLMEQGWRARENFEFERSEVFLEEAKRLFEREGDWHNVSECLNHLAYLYKVMAFSKALKAVDYVKESLEMCADKGVSDVLSLRAASSIYKYAGEFEKVEKYIKAFIEKQDSPAARADMRGDLAFSCMRRGNLAKAKEEIEVAFKELEAGWEKERMPHKMIWKTKLLMFKSLILYNGNEIREAKALVEEALKLSRENNLEMRTREAQELLTLFSP